MRKIWSGALAVLDALAFIFGLMLVASMIATFFETETWLGRIQTAVVAAVVAGMLIGVARTWRRPRWLSSW